MRLTVVLLALAAAPAAAQTIYRCDVGGRVQYSGTTFQSGPDLKRMAPPGGPTEEDRARAKLRYQEALARQRAKETDE